LEQVKRSGYSLCSPVFRVIFLKCFTIVDTGAECEPKIAQWRLASLPKYLVAEEIERVMASCDLSTPIGVRDRAVLLLLSRLGFRSGDVANLKLSDINWDEATVEVAGKSRRSRRLPLPQDVGDAILSYLEQRPQVACPQVFIRLSDSIRTNIAHVPYLFR
jgi:integrase